MKIKTITAPSKDAKTGEAIKWTVTADGDAAAYDCHWRVFKDGAEYQTPGWTDALTYDFTPTAAGEYRMQCRLKDAAGTRSDYAKSATVTVTQGTVAQDTTTTQTTDVKALIQDIIAKQDALIALLEAQ